MKILADTAKQINYVYHIADIHIRLFERHDEYRDVFNKFFNQLKSNPDLDNSVITVVGDILHSKTELKPECIQLTRWFFSELAEILPVFVVCGNHDTNMSNKSRLDSLTPILDKIDNTYYLKTTRHYRYNNIVFGLTSIHEKKILPALPESEMPAGAVQIALFHGAVHKSRTDAGFRLTSKKYLVENFKGYDISMLGDVHKHQYLDAAKRIAYSSSLIQQNHGETAHGHGYIRWDLNSLVGEFVEVPNDYGFFTVKISDGKIVSDTDVIKMKPWLRFEVSGTDSLESKSLIDKFCKGYHVQNVLSYPVITPTNTKSSEEDGIKTKRLHNLGDTVSWLEKLVSKDEFDSVKVLHEKYSEIIPASERPDTQNWKLHKLEFTNMFCYTNRVEIDFNKYYQQGDDYMGKIVGILGSNHSGKSSILDIILYCLYDKCSRGDRKEVINCNRKDFQCRLTLEVNNKIYYIHRVGTKNKSSVKVDVYFRRLEDGEEISLEGNDRYATNKKIANLIGSYEDLIVTSISLQNEATKFITMSQSNRKKLLNDLLRLDFYDKLYEKANGDLREMLTEIKLLTKNHKVDRLDSLQDNLEDYQKRLTAEQERLAETEELIKTLQGEKEEVIKQYIQLEFEMESGFDVTELEHELHSNDNKILKVDKFLADNSLESITEQISELQEEYNQALMDYTTNYNEINAQIKLYRSHIENLVDVPYSEEQLKQLKFEIENNASPEFINKEVVFLEDIQGKLELFEDDDDIVYINQQIEARLEDLKSATNKKNNLTISIITKYLHQHKQNREIQERNNQNNALIKGEKERLNSLDRPDDLLDELNRTKKQQAKIKQFHESKKELEEYSTDLREQIDEYKKYCDQLEHNKGIKAQEKKIKAKIDGYDMKLKKLRQTVTSLISDISVTRQKISDINTAKQKIEFLHNKQKHLATYVKTVHKNGIPYIQLKETVPFLEQKVNQILTLLTDFTVEIIMEEKNIDINLCRDGTSISIVMASGFEKFICSIAIRVAMMNISLLPKSNFIAIDEGFGALDAENLAGINVLFDYLKTDFDIVLVISHIDLLKNEIEDLIIPEELKRNADKNKIGQPVPIRPLPQSSVVKTKTVSKESDSTKTSSSGLKKYGIIKMKPAVKKPVVVKMR